jgi:PAS domain S-box-containing protein
MAILRATKSSEDAVAQKIEPADAAFPDVPVIIEKSLDGRVTSWNEGAASVFGYAPAEIVGRHVSLIIPFDWQDEEYEMIERMRSGEAPEPRKTVRRTRDGTQFWVELLTLPIFDNDGKIIGAEQRFSNFVYYAG